MQASFSPLRRWLALLFIVGLLLFAAFLWLRPLLNIGSGYAAKHACSCHFLQGRELEEISTHDLNFSVLGWFSLAVEGQTVRASLLSLVAREAHYRPGVGCTLVNDPNQALAPILGADAGAPPRPPEGGSKDEGAMLVNPTETTPALTAALDFGMEPVPGGGARGIVVLQDGKLLAETYAPGFDRTTPLLGWSMTKTLTALLVGHVLLAPDGSNLEEVVNRKRLYPAWNTDARANIRLADLLHMNSGLAWNEGYGSLTDATIMLHEQPAMAAYASGMPAEFAPGETWRYSSGTTNILADLVQRQLPPGTDLATYLRAYFRPVAPSLLVEPDQSGLPVGSSYGWATAQDWARLGQFMLQDGVWGGDTLLPPGWIDWLQQPAAGSEGTYGGQLWLPGPDMPSLPPDAFMMRGFQDQRVFIIPSRRLVIARLGHGEDKVTDFDGLVSRILAAVE
ncbi:serine hydrolase [Neolewinella lacunae]|uniref:Serine hydrolase n=1 Tax=Neolewinella lacunae TaxID=1517758 RepID=A0A923PNV0_9BACT|nr:serine hydrolase [Neolewinella lacunae]MBC6994744.1 serine hydrolase [Neolewinella lacunae]MDN3634366.1 serine hydrolase [Neolewinella lacunae]